MSRQSSLWKAIGGLAAAGSAGLAAYAFAIGPWHRRWGATDVEVARALPDDQGRKMIRGIKQRVETTESNRSKESYTEAQ